MAKEAQDLQRIIDELGDRSRFPASLRDTFIELEACMRSGDINGAESALCEVPHQSGGDPGGGWPLARFVKDMRSLIQAVRTRAMMMGASPALLGIDEATERQAEALVQHIEDDAKW